MQILRTKDLPKVPWKNGAGITCEIACGKPGQGATNRLAWRLSLATVSNDAAFSDFSGYTRILTVVDGNGMQLTTSGRVIMADLACPVTFDGGLAVHGQLNDGPVQNFNLIFDPARVQATLKSIAGPLVLPLTPTASQTVAIYAVTAGADGGRAGALSPGDVGLYGPIERDPCRIKLGIGARAMVAHIIDI